jgi:hypothetical protein
MTGPAPYQRSRERMPDAVWTATLARIRSEFDEMPCMRVTLRQAGALFGLSDRVVNGILSRLTAEGFLSLTDQGEFIRRQTTP